MKKIILISLLLVIVTISVYSQDTIEIVIDGEEYIREFPTNLVDSTILIKQLVEMYNEVSVRYTELKLQYDKLYEESTNTLIEINNTIGDSINTVDNAMKELNKVKLINSNLAISIGIAYYNGVFNYYLGQ